MRWDVVFGYTRGSPTVDPEWLTCSERATKPDHRPILVNVFGEGHEARP